MKLTNEFTVAAPVDATWRTLLDLERVASCLPGATIAPGDTDGTFRGRMKVKLGAVTTEYDGVATLREVDEDGHVAVFDVRGKEARGHGSASASITNRVRQDGSGTRVTVETDLHVTGRPAQFGRGIMQDVATAMLGEFARRLEREITAGPATPDAPAVGESPGRVATATATDTSAAEPPQPPAPADDDVLDMGAVAWKPIAKRIAPAAAGIALVALVAMRAARRRRITLRIDL